MDGPAADGVLVTRPAAGAAETALRLEAMGWRPVVAPMLYVAPSSEPLPPAASVQALLVTSAAAIAFLPTDFHATRLLAVGDATADQARRAGFRHVESAGADAAALAILATARCETAGAPLLLAGAAGQGEKLATRLSASGFRVLRHAVYDARPVRDLPEPARRNLIDGRLAAGLFFSAATAQAFVTAFLRACAPEIVFNTYALAISEEAAAALAPLPWRRIRVATRPNQDELLALLP